MKLSSLAVALLVTASVLARVRSTEGAVIFTSQHRELDDFQTRTPTSYGALLGDMPSSGESFNIAPDYSDYSWGATYHSSLATTIDGGATISFFYHGIQSQNMGLQYVTSEYTYVDNRVTFQIDQPEAVSFTYAGMFGDLELSGGVWNLPFTFGVESTSTSSTTLAPGTYTLEYTESQQRMPPIGTGANDTFTLTPAPEPSTLLLSLLTAPLLLRRSRSRLC